KSAEVPDFIAQTRVDFGELVAPESVALVEGRARRVVAGCPVMPAAAKTSCLDYPLGTTVVPCRAWRLISGS
ncbi:MAG TPA: hypothetical protein VFZ59_28005, partial [Verrucomicrobiae bacterium]|nr:hypothetical protein [Verrucomicrobiae bacterium]